MFAGAVFVNGARDHILAHPWFSENQDSCLSLGDLQRLLPCLSERRALETATKMLALGLAERYGVEIQVQGDFGDASEWGKDTRVAVSVGK